jgi:hypothetical protein
VVQATVSVIMAKLSKRWVINFILFFLIICLSYIGQKYDVKPGYQAESRITTLKASNIQTVVMQTRDSRILMQRSDAGWNMIEPVVTPANSISVERIISIVNQHTESRLLVEEAELAQFGLDQPIALLRLDDTDIHFGTTNNIGDRRYIRIFSTVYLIPDNHLPFMQEGPIGFIDRRLLPASYPLEQLDLPGMSITRNANMAWQSNKSKKSPDQVNQLIDHWRTLDPLRIKAHESTVTPKSSIKAHLENGSTLVYYLLTIQPELIIARPDIRIQYHFNKDNYYQLLDISNDGISDNESQTD